MTFEKWKQSVDKLCLAWLGMDSASIVGDWPARDTFDGGETPEEALQEIYKAGELDTYGIRLP